MKYLAYHFTVSPSQPGSDILQAFLADRGFESFEQKEDGFTAYIQDALSEKLQLNDLEFDDFKFSWKVERFEEVNWNAEWEKNFSPVMVDKLLCIRAPFHQMEHACLHEIVIMPKMSFGTGHHETTRLVCRQMFDMKVRQTKILDMGTGTGILAILGKKLGAGHVVGVDNDAWSVENAKENCARNGCPEIDLREGDERSLKDNEQFDIILANINRNVLKTQLPAFKHHNVKNGLLLISGFFVTDADELVKLAAKQGFVLLDSSSEKEWCALLFRRGV